MGLAEKDTDVLDQTQTRLVHANGGTAVVPAHKVAKLLVLGFTREAQASSTGLAALSLAALKAEAETRGLPTSGRKADLVGRIEAHDAELDAVDEDDDEGDLDDEDDDLDDQDGE